VLRASAVGPAADAARLGHALAEALLDRGAADVTVLQPLGSATR
jgi:hypothetical protein